jgi:preprotein translocase subunit YajC
MTKMLLLPSASIFFAQQPAAPSTTQTLLSFAPMLLLIGGFYFLFIAPQMKKQKEHKAMLGALKTGDEVVTTGGIFGTITNVKEDRFVVRIADNTKIEVTKDAVQVVLKKSSEEKK